MYFRTHAANIVRIDPETSSGRQFVLPLKLWRTTSVERGIVMVKKNKGKCL